MRKALRCDRSIECRENKLGSKQRDEQGASGDHRCAGYLRAATWIALRMRA